MSSITRVPKVAKDPGRSMAQEYEGSRRIGERDRGVDGEGNGASLFDRIVATAPRHELCGVRITEEGQSIRASVDVSGDCAKRAGSKARSICYGGVDSECFADADNLLDQRLTRDQQPS